MPGLLEEPFKLEYSGHDADNHTVDALQLGHSLAGTAKLYNSVARFHLQGIVSARGHQEIRIHVGPPKRGSIFYAIYLMMAHGKLALYPDFIYGLAKLAIPATIKAIVARRSGQEKLMEKSMDMIAEQYRMQDRFARQVHRDHVKEKEMLFKAIGQLAEINRRPLAEVSAPVGRSVKQIEHFPDTDAKVLIDEPTAEALRTTTGSVSVGDEKKFVATVLGVDTTTGAAKLQIEGEAKPTKAKITDPAALMLAENVYTHALDKKHLIQISAKPVIKNGKVATLYVSNAKPAS